MLIKHPISTKKQSYFGNASIGDTFLYKGLVFMKILVGSYNAVCLDDATVYSIFTSDLVDMIDGEFSYKIKTE